MSAIEASLKLEIAQYQAALARAQGDIRKFREGAKKQGGMLSNDLFGGLKSGLAGLGVGLSAGFMAKAAKGVLAQMDDLADASLKLNETPETLQRVEFASKQLASVDINTVANNFLKLERSLGDVENKAANQALERYGVTAAQLTRLTLDQKITTLADAFQKARKDGTGFYDLQQLLGRSAGDLIPLLETSSDKIRELYGQAEAVPDGAVLFMASMNDQLDAFSANLGKSVSIGFGSFLMNVKDVFSGKPVGTTVFEEAMKAEEQAAAQTEKREQAAKRLEEQAAQRAEEAAQKERDKQAVQDAALANFERELDIINAQIAGKEKLVQQLREEAEIEKLKKRIMEQTGADEAAALQMAEERVAAERRLKEMQTGGGRYDAEGRRADGRKQIKGYSQEQGGTAEASARAAGRIDEARAKREIPSGLDAFAADRGLGERMERRGVKSMFPGLEGAFGTGGTHEVRAAGSTSPLADTAAMNAAAADRQPGDAARGLEDKLDRLIAISEQGLLGE
jgi:flagellar biosynthesis GTPase FlhF